MEKGLGDLGFWLAVGIVIAAMVVAGAFKERAKERERQATLRALLEMKSDNASEVLAYLREKDAAESAARLLRKRMTPRQEMAFMGAFMLGLFSLMGGFFALVFHNQPKFPRMEFSAQAGRVIPVYPPPPTPLESLLPLGVALGIWAVGLILVVLIVKWGGFGRETNDARPDA